MARYRVSRSADGRYRATVSVHHRVDREMAAGVLVYNFECFGDRPPDVYVSRGDRPKLWMAVREYLTRNGDMNPWELVTAPSDETVDLAYDAVDRLWPELNMKEDQHGR